MLIGLVYQKDSLDSKLYTDLLSPEIYELQMRYDSAVILIGGDLNGRVGMGNCLQDEQFDSTCLFTERISFNNTTDKRGKAVMDTFDKSGMFLINGRTTGDRYTYSSPTCRIINDLIWANSEPIQVIKNIKLNKTVNLFDYFPLILELKTVLKSIIMHSQ